MVSPKGKVRIVFQPPFFKGCVSFEGGYYHCIYHSNTIWEVNCLICFCPGSNHLKQIQDQQYDSQQFVLVFV